MKAKTIPQQATIKKNKTVVQDLEMIRGAIYDGRLDDVLSLVNFGSDQDKCRPKTMAEIDQSIKYLRQSKVDSVNFALQQVRMFSTFLRRNCNYSSRDHGYQADMILAHISEDDFVTLAIRIVSAMKQLDHNLEGHSYRKAFEKLQNQAKDRLDAQ